MSERLQDVGTDLMGVVGRLSDPEIALDPYPYYAELRGGARAYHAAGRWLFVRHRDCAAVLNDKRWNRHVELQCLPDSTVCPVPLQVSDVRQQAEPETTGTGRPADLALSLEYILKNDVAPKRFRSIFVREFSGKAVRRLESRIEELVDTMLDSMVGAGTVDFIDSFAYPLPVTVICELLGIPAADHDLVKKWSFDIIRATDPLFTLSAEDIARRDQTGQELAEYFGGLLAERRQRPGDDVLTSLVTSEEGRRLSEEEQIAACIMLVVTGHENVVNLLGLGTLALSRDPGQFGLLQRDPGLTRGAVEELVRYDSPAQTVPRIALEDAEVNGYAVRKGETAIALLGSANHDPAVFSGPDRLDVTRQDNDHLGFAQGALYCPGAALARMQARIAFGALARRVSRLELAGEPERKQTFCIRGLAKLPVRLTSS